MLRGALRSILPRLCRGGGKGNNEAVRAGRTTRALWAFIAGRGAQEKTYGELKGEFAFDVVPTHHYGANSAWQHLSVLAHNLLRSQLRTLAIAKPRSRKRTYAFAFRSLRTLRFLLIARAGRLARIDGRQVLRLTQDPRNRSAL